MTNALNQYNQNTVYVRGYGQLYEMLLTNLPSLSQQAEMLLRAQWVMAVSAFDTFFHDVVRIGLIEMFVGNRPVSNGAKNYLVSYNALKAILDANSIIDKQLLLNNEIRRINSKDAFQSPQSIEYVMSILGIQNIWNKISPTIGMRAVDIKDQLAIIVRRRNQIAHESDINPATSCQIPISKSDVDNMTSFMDRIVNAVYQLL